MAAAQPRAAAGYVVRPRTPDPQTDPDQGQQGPKDSERPRRRRRGETLVHAPEHPGGRDAALLLVEEEPRVVRVAPVVAQQEQPPGRHPHVDGPVAGFTSPRIRYGSSTGLPFTVIRFPSHTT